MAYDKQDLAQLGKRASNLHINHGMPLGDAVVKVAQDTSGLSEHHITRVLENANLITFEEKFKGGDEKHVVFDLADPLYVSKQLDAQSASPEPIDEAYLSRPNYRSSSDPTIFDHEGEEKMSSYLDVNSAFNTRQQFITASHASQHMRSDLNRIDSNTEYEMSKLASIVSNLAVQASSASAPMELMSYAAKDHDVFEKVAHTISYSIPSSVPRGEYTGQAPNMSHPVCAQYKVVEGLVKEASNVKKGLIDIERYRDQLFKEIKG
jgi:hypothetical protein